MIYRKISPLFTNNILSTKVNDKQRPSSETDDIKACNQGTVRADSLEVGCQLPKGV